VRHRTQRVVAPDTTVRASRFELGGEEFIVLSFPVRLPAERFGLSPSEREVLEHLARGSSNAEIARARGVALRTVANQVAAILRKVGVSSRIELIAKLGLGETG
jgi:DNA-binding NarL/FixJ family response regulator